jgi:NAD(P)-dependent dehydrogenase (short-subunit alcohol dehydrogenase family)
MDFKDKNIIITGGASGMGLAVAKEVKSAGGMPIIFDINSEAANVSKQLSCQSFNVDVSDEVSVTKAFNTLKDINTKVHGLVNCAGIATAHKLIGKKGPMPTELFHKVLHVNLLGTFLFMQQAVQIMQENTPNSEGERGVIVNTASVAAFEGQVGQVAYSASKAGIVGMTLPAARDLASLGIRVMCIAPGLMDTPLLQSLPEETCKSLHAQTPFPSRFGKPEEFSSLVAHIFNNPMLNGETIRMDGALRMQPR